MIELFQKSPFFASAADAVRILEAHGHKAFFVGGAVRDMIMGYPPKDIDIATSATPDEVASLFPHNVQVGIAFGIIKAIHKGNIIEIATFRKDREYFDGRRPTSVSYAQDPFYDAERRDFTINALYYSPTTDKVLDFFSGLSDIRKGILRTVGNAHQRFSEDYLRILRAIRFATRFCLRVDTEIYYAICDLKSCLTKLSAERIRDELCLMLKPPYASNAFRLMLKTGILQVILPEIAALHGVEQHHEYHPEGDVLEHTFLMLEHLALPNQELAWSILLHDVGKPLCRTVGEDGISHFYKHDSKGAELAKQILSRLKFPNSFISNVVCAVSNHMTLAHVDKMKEAKWKRLLSSETFPLELELHRIDCISSHRKMDKYCLMLERLSQLEGEQKLPQPYISGRDLIALGLKPGPSFSIILKEFFDRQLEGEFPDRDAALKELQKSIR